MINIGNPEFKEDGWIGFTRDYQESINSFSDDGCILNNLPEYLIDLKERLKKKQDED